MTTVSERSPLYTVCLFTCSLYPPPVGEALSEASDGLSPVAAVSVSCNGSESSLSQCSSSPNNGCSSDSTVAGLRCTQGEALSAS